MYMRVPLATSFISRTWRKASVIDDIIKITAQAYSILVWVFIKIEWTSYGK